MMTLNSVESLLLGLTAETVTGVLFLLMLSAISYLAFKWDKERNERSEDAKVYMKNLKAAYDEKEEIHKEYNTKFVDLTKDFIEITKGLEKSQIAMASATKHMADVVEIVFKGNS